ncbi:glycosyltransferase [Streptomyces sp. NPDC046866]|uniref:glycosyltransferase n=1 Tax=Streptomyces sp. NPDC046866 TaxID=3154921 RepID=UPI0034533E2E
MRRRLPRRTDGRSPAQRREAGEAPRRRAARVARRGAVEGERAAVLARIAELGLADRFTVPGALSAEGVQEELRRAHVYVLPSVDEPFPMSVLEALAVGVPSVVTHSNGLAGDITAAGAGRAVEPGPTGVAAAVLELLAPAANATASAAARRLAAESFSMDTVLDTLLPVYEAALSRR